MQEVWKTIENTNNTYFISNMGNVKSLKGRNANGRILKPYIINSGYKMVNMMVDGKKQRKLVHRLVASSFLHLKEGLVVNHKNGDKLDNRLVNLEVCSYKENSEHAHKNGLVNMNSVRKKVNMYDMQYNYQESFDSITEAFNKTKIDISGISKCCRGLRDHAGGYKWSFNI